MLTESDCYIVHALFFLSVMFLQSHISNLSLSLACTSLLPVGFHTVHLSLLIMTASSDTSSHTLTKVDTRSVSKRKGPPHWHVVASHALVAPAVLHHHYNGSGTKEDPYMVEFIPDDPRNPMKLFNGEEMVNHTPSCCCYISSGICLFRLHRRYPSNHPAIWNQ